MKVYFGEDDSVISCSDFVDVTLSATNSISESQAKNLFYYLDVNGSGTLSKNEVQIVLGTGKLPQNRKTEV